MGCEQSQPANNPSPRGNIDINILTGIDSCDTYVIASGYRTRVIDEDDQKAFRITEFKLKKAVEAYHGKRPTDVFVKSPTKWGDLYTKHKNWYPVERTVRVVKARVIDTKSTLVGVATRRYINNSDEYGTYNTSFTETATNTISSTWSEEFSANAGIDYDIQFPGSPKLSFSSTISHNLNRTKTVSIAAQSSVTCTLAPGRSVLVHLRSRRNTVYVEVDYEISLKGDVVCNYDGTHKGSCFWALGVNKILDAVDKPTVLNTSEILEINYYSDGEIVLDKINKHCSRSDGYCMRHGVRDYKLHYESDSD